MFTQKSTFDWKAGCIMRWWQHCDQMWDRKATVLKKRESPFIRQRGSKILVNGNGLLVTKEPLITTGTDGTPTVQRPDFGVIFIENTGFGERDLWGYYNEGLSTNTQGSVAEKC